MPEGVNGSVRGRAAPSAEQGIRRDPQEFRHAYRHLADHQNAKYRRGHSADAARTWSRSAAAVCLHLFHPKFLLTLIFVNFRCFSALSTFCLFFVYFLSTLCLHRLYIPYPKHVFSEPVFNTVFKRNKGKQRRTDG